MTDFIPNHVTKAVGGLKKDLSNSSTISSKKLAERTLAFLEDSLTQINKNNPDISRAAICTRKTTIVQLHNHTISSQNCKTQHNYTIDCKHNKYN